MATGILETISIEKAITLATPAAKKIYEKTIEPIITKKIKDYFKTKIALKKFETETVNYLAKIGAQCSIMNTIAFQNSPKNLKDLYVPLTLVNEPKDEKITIDDRANIFSRYKHILVSDAAGMGKSTLSKKIILNIISQEKSIPVYIELRKLQKTPIETQIKTFLGLDENFDSKELSNLPIAYIFDGLDEIPNDFKAKAIELLKSFIHDFNGSYILITSRYESYLSEFYGFHHYSIKPLKNAEAFQLLKNCDPAGTISTPLIESLEKSRDNSIRDFLSTPLYVSLLFCAYRYKTVIPQKKNLFYSQVYEALFESHDLSKEVGYVRKKHSNLDSADFHLILRRLGFWCLKNNGKIEFQKDELDIVVAELLQKISGLSTSAPNFTKDLTSTVPLFVKEGPIVRWSHKSLMEYFAAMFICNDTKGKQIETLSSLFNSPHKTNYTNTFELCADIDYSSFRSSIAKQILEDFVYYSDNNYQKIANNKITKQEINRRLGLNFVTNVAFAKHTNLDDCDTEWGITSTSEKLKKNKPNFRNKENSSHDEVIYQFDQSEVIHYTFSQLHNLKILNIIKARSPKLFLKFDNLKFKNFFPAQSSLKNKKTYVIDDNPKNITNNSSNFDISTQIMSVLNDTALDINSVRAELISIANDTSNGIDSLLEGL